MVADPSTGVRADPVVSQPTTGAQVLVSALEEAGSEVAFAIPSVHNLAIFDALADSTLIRCIVTRHEEGAGYMADGYARASGRPAAIVTFAGPGISNTLTAIGTVNADYVPIIVFAASLAKDQVDRQKGDLHDVTGQLEAVRPH